MALGPLSHHRWLQDLKCWCYQLWLNFVFCFKNLVLMVWLLLCLIFLLWDLCWFSWLFCKTETVFGLTSYPDISRKTFINCFGCGFWLHIYKVKQTILFYTRNEKKQLSMAVVLSPTASVDLGFAPGEYWRSKEVFPPHFLGGLIFIFFFSCYSFWLSPPFPSFDKKKNNRSRLGRRGWEAAKERKPTFHCISILSFLYIIFFLRVERLWNSNWFYTRES